MAGWSIVMVAGELYEVKFKYTSVLCELNESMSGSANQNSVSICPLAGPACSRKNSSSVMKTKPLPNVVLAVFRSIGIRHSISERPKAPHIDKPFITCTLTQYHQ